MLNTKIRIFMLAPCAW